MKEWNSPFNPFNSMKTLMWREQLEGIAKEEFLPPVTVDIDPTNKCNFHCMWCNAFDYMKGSKHTMTGEHMVRIADFCKEWGVYSACVAGGGEPLINPDLNMLLNRLHENGIQSGVITNGSLMKDEHIETIARCCRWCGFSVDSASPETFAKVKGIKNLRLYDKIIDNIGKLVKRSKETDSNCDVAYKYLLHPENATEIYEAAKLAKSLGVHDFHLRPVGWDNLSVTKGKKNIDFEPLIHTIDGQIEDALELEDENFHFYGIRHKFNPNMKRKINFSRCWAPPLLATFGADGYYHLCFDMRGRKDLIMVPHDPDPREILKFWGSEKHKEMIRNIDITKCPRCTFGPYNEMIEKVFIEDNMCRFFP